MGPYPFETFHTSLGSTLCTESELKSDLSLGGPSLLALICVGVNSPVVTNFNPLTVKFF
jgi:hypothetical protein